MSEILKQIVQAPEEVETTSVHGKIYKIDALRKFAEQFPIVDIDIERVRGATSEGNIYWEGLDGKGLGPFHILKDWEAAQKNPAWVNHVASIKRADATMPIWITKEGIVFDGVHRLTRAVLDGKKTIKARIFEKFPNSIHTKDAVKEYIFSQLEQPLIEERKKELSHELATVSDFFSDAGIEFYIAGGSGLDLRDGKWDRDHQDVDAAIFNSERRKFFDAAKKAGYLITDPDHTHLDISDVLDEKRENVFLFRSDERGQSSFEVMFVDENKNNLKQLYVDSRIVEIAGREIHLQPVEIILFHKLLDARRKDMKDILKIWVDISVDERVRLQNLVDQSGVVFILHGKRTSDIETVLHDAPVISSQKESVFFEDDALEIIEHTVYEELLEKCEIAYYMRLSTANKKDFFNAISEKYSGFLPEKKAVTEAMADYLYQVPKPSLIEFKNWAKKRVGRLEDIQRSALHNFINQKIWEVEVM